MNVIPAWHGWRELVEWNMHCAELTPRQRQVSWLVFQGCSNKEIAIALGVAEQTAKDHLQETYYKLRVNDRTQLILTLLDLPKDGI